MPEILTANDTIQCPHGGTVTIIPGQGRASADSGFMLRASDGFVVAGCAFSTPAAVPHPCMMVEWSAPSVKCKADNEAVLTTASIGMCKAGDQAPQGPATVQKSQKKVSAT